MPIFDSASLSLRNRSRSRSSIKNPSQEEEKLEMENEGICHQTTNVTDRKRRKSVTFADTDYETPLVRSSSLSSNASRRGEPLPALRVVNGPQSDKRNHRESWDSDLSYELESPASPRKRRFSNVDPPSDESEPGTPTPTQDHPSPRKRRFSTLVPTNSNHTPPSEARLSESASFRIPPPSQAPPPIFCDEVNQMIRSTMDIPSFDFAQHVKCRTYVVRLLPVSPPHECVGMLDEEVDALLPDYFKTPHLAYEENYRIEKSTGKGLGLFAAKHIRANQDILAEHPVVIMPYVLGLGVPLSQIYGDVFRTLSKAVRQELMDLSFACSSEVPDDPDAYETITRVNTLAVSLTVPKGEFAELPTHRGIFRLVTRCNHSCGPNAKWSWNETSLCLILTALRDIEPGEEITISYLPSHQSFETRRQRLRKMYSFDCSCDFCLRKPADLEKSDKARMEVTSFWDRGSASVPLPSFDAWCVDPSIPDDILILAHKRALDNIEREGLQAFDSGTGSPHPMRDVGRHIDAIALCYAALEDYVQFEKWIAKALEAREGREPEARAALKGWLVEPESFPVWGWRKAFLAKNVRELGKRKDDVLEGTSSGLFMCVELGMFDYV